MSNTYKLVDFLMPILRSFYKCEFIGTENLEEAAKNGKVLVAATHASWFASFYVTAGVCETLEDKAYFMVFERLKKILPIYLAFKGKNVIWVPPNHNTIKTAAIRKSYSALLGDKTKSLVIAPHGKVNLPYPNELDFKEGFASAAIYATNQNVKISVVPAVDIGFPYTTIPYTTIVGAFTDAWPPFGKKICAIYGKPIEVTKDMDKKDLTKRAKGAAQEIMQKYANYN